MEGKVTMTELKSIISFDELMEINALLDMKQDLEIESQKVAERNRK